MDLPAAWMPQPFTGANQCLQRRWGKNISLFSKNTLRQAVCQSNLRQIGFAAAMYAEDNDHKVPRGTGTGRHILWFQVFLPYLAQDKDKKDYRDVKSYRCPSYPDKRQTVCYVVNGWGFEHERDTIGFEVMNLSVKLFNYRLLSETIDQELEMWRFRKK